MDSMSKINIDSTIESGNNIIYIPPVTLDKIKKKEIDNIIELIDTKYKNIILMSSKLEKSVSINAYRSTDFVLEQFITEIDDMILILRKIRKKFQRVGFSGLRLMNRSDDIINIVDSIENIKKFLVNMRNFIIGVKMYENIVGVLDEYIEKMGNLLDGTNKWIENLF